MLTRLRVKNFKLLRDVDIHFAHPLTVFIGPNAAGKSTVLEVVDFLRRCSDVGLQDAVRAHGGMGAIRTLGAKDPVEIESTWELSVSPPQKQMRIFKLTWSLAFEPGTLGAVVRREQLDDLGEQRVGTDPDGTRLIYDETGGGGPTKHQDQSKLAFESVRDPDRFPSLRWLGAVTQFARYVGVLSTAAPWTRASAERASARDSVVIAPEPFLGAEGLGLANVLYNLHTDHLDAWNSLLRAFSAEYPFVQRIVFPVDVGGSKVSFAFEDRRFPGTKTYAGQMSDGMIALLALLASALQPYQRGVLALDEPDAHLHPSALRRFLSVCQKRGIPRTIAIVTHSNALLDALDDPAAAIRIVEPGPDGARIRTLDADALAAWRKDYSLSELRSTGMLDHDNTTYEPMP